MCGAGTSVRHAMCSFSSLPFSVAAPLVSRPLAAPPRGVQKKCAMQASALWLLCTVSRALCLTAHQCVRPWALTAHQCIRPWALSSVISLYVRPLPPRYWGVPGQPPLPSTLRTHQVPLRLSSHIFNAHPPHCAHGGAWCLSGQPQRHQRGEGIARLADKSHRQPRSCRLLQVCRVHVRACVRTCVRASCV